MKGISSRAVVALALTAAVGVGAPAAAYASSPTSTTTTIPSASFVSAQTTLEANLASRLTRLQHLTADVTGAASLSAATAATLQARLSTEEAEITTLAAKVPTDTTNSELRADRAAMYKDNRVYAVMSPQVFELVEASVVANQVAAMQSNEATLESEVVSLNGLAGYQNALHHYNNFVQRITNWSTKIVTIQDAVLAQTPQGFPGNTGVFVNANRQILRANIALAYASYDASIIGLAAGGYTGS